MGRVGGSQGTVWVLPGRTQPTFCSDPLGDAEPGLGAGRGRMPISMCTQGRELQGAPMVGFQGGSVKTLGGVVSLVAKEHLCFRFQMSLWPQAGKKEICDVCRGDVACLNL